MGPHQHRRKETVVGRSVGKFTNCSLKQICRCIFKQNQVLVKIPQLDLRVYWSVATSPKEVDVSRGYFHRKLRYQATAERGKQEIWKKQRYIQENHVTHIQNTKHSRCLRHLWGQTYWTQDAIGRTGQKTKESLRVSWLKKICLFKILFLVWRWFVGYFGFLWPRRCSTPHVKTFRQL